jgi:parallel beta-helix repeat protein
VTISGHGFHSATGVVFNGTAAIFSVQSDNSISATVPAGATSGQISVTSSSGTTSAGSFTVTGSSPPPPPPPSITGFAPASGPPGTAVTISGSGLTGATAVSFGGASATYTVASDNQIDATVPTGASSGPVSVTTPTGTALSSSTFTITVVTPGPSISSFSPASGPPGTIVTINGTNLTGATAVLFTGTSASPTVVSDSEITAIVPDGASTGPIGVTTPNGSATSSSDFTVTTTPTPSISGFSPTNGLAGTVVTIDGTNLSGATSVTFYNGAAAASFTVVSDSQLTATVPAAARTGPISVTVAGAGGVVTSSGSFAVTTVPNAPSISSFSPSSGPVGTIVTISGSNLSGASAVSFGGASASSYTVDSDSQITATVPTYAVSGPIGVTTPGGTATSSGSFSVAIPVATINGVSPTSGPIGAAVTITGSGLSATTSVSFNGTYAGYTVDSDSQLTATVPAGATSGPITVTTTAGPATYLTRTGAAPTFSVMPGISSFSPTSGEAGTTVTINGSGFTGATGVDFNGTAAASFTVVSDSQLTATAPNGTSGPITVTTPAGQAVSATDFVFPTAVLYVDNTNLSCSDTGPGTSSQPFCTIAKGGQVATSGSTVLVVAGTYAGTSVNPTNDGVTFSASPGVTIQGGPSAFVLSNHNDIVVSGFTITGTTSYGISVSGGSNVTISSNAESYAGTPVAAPAAGIYLNNVAGGLVSDNVTHDNSAHGIYLNGSTTGVLVKGNTSYHNAYQYVRNANGIEDVAAGNSIVGNITYDNEDSGINIYPGGDNALVAGNVSYHNGDHGIDDLNVTGGRLIGNTIYDNCTTGINVEGTSGNYLVENNVSMDNATGAIINPTPIAIDPNTNQPYYTNDCNRRHGNIGIWDSAPATSSADYNLVYQSNGTSPDYVWAGTVYSSQQALYAATGQEAHGIFANPLFADTANWNLQLTGSSPAIDSADSLASGEQTLDLLGNPRVDDTVVPNIGNPAGSYYDRGAYEYQASDGPPVPALTLTPSSGPAPLTVTANASASTDTDTTPIASYSFDFGDGTTVGPQTGATATHTYSAAGTYTVTVTVTDTANQSASTTAQVVVNDSPPHAALTVSPSSGDTSTTFTADASASTAGSTPIATYTFDFGDGSAVVGPQATATATHTYSSAGNYTVTVTVADTGNLSSQATQLVSVSSSNDFAPVARLSVTPTSGYLPLQVGADASASTDTDTTLISTYSFDFGDGTAVVGPQASATTSHLYTSPGTYTVTVTVTDTGGLTGTASKTVTVTDEPPIAALSVSPTSGAAPLSVGADASASTAGSTPISTYSFDFGDGSAVVGPQTGATATHTYYTAGTYTVTVTVTDTVGGSSQTTQQVVVSAGIVGNPGFETGLSGWNTSGSGTGVTLTQVAGGHSGNYAAALTNPGPGSNGCTLNDSPNWVTSTVAGTYTATIWVRSDDSGRSFNLRFREYTAGTGGSLVGTTMTTATLSTSWTQVTVSYTVATAGTTLDLNAYTTNGNSPPGVCFYADDVAITFGP